MDAFVTVFLQSELSRRTKENKNYNQPTLMRLNYPLKIYNFSSWEVGERRKKEVWLAFFTQKFVFRHQYRCLSVHLSFSRHLQFLWCSFNHHIIYCFFSTTYHCKTFARTFLTSFQFSLRQISISVRHLLLVRRL